MQIDSLVSERRRKRKQRRKYFFGIIAFLAAYFIFLGTFSFIVRLPAFQAKQIVVQGNSVIPSTDIMNLLHASILRKGNSLTAPNSGWNAMLGFNNMLIWPDALPASTTAIIPQLAGVTISKNYFLHTITVTATEREPFGVWCLTPASLASVASSSIEGDELCFWFDPQGMIFGRADDTQGNAILVVHDYAQSSLAIGETILPSAFVSNFISIANVLKQSGLDIQDIALNDLSLQQINVTTVNGTSLYFSLRFSADDDLGVIQSLMAQSGFNKLQYIDFTVQNRAYYK